jgi:PAS domain S-box-containing protein
MAFERNALSEVPSKAHEIDGLARQIIDRLHDGFCAVDSEWRILYANRRAAQMWGTPDDTMIGSPLWDCAASLADSSNGRRLRRAVESGKTTEFEMPSPVLARWLWVRVDPVSSDIIGISWRDITLRKRAEHALRESEARFRRVFEQSPLGKATAGADFRFREVNPALGTMLGYGPDELVGRSFFDLVHPEDRDSCRRRGTAMVAGKLPHLQLEERLLRKSGEPMWVRINVGPIRDGAGEFQYCLGIIEDIDERKRIEAELARLADELRARVDRHRRELDETKDRLRRERLVSELIVESTAEGIIVVDQAMRHLLWNAGMERINGLPRGVVLGKTVFEAFPHLADSPVGDAWRAALAGRPTELRARRYFAPARGQEIVYDADHEPLYDQSGAIVGAVAIIRETTERHQIEEMLRQSQKMEAVAQLTGGVAHDFNNLLTAVIGCLDIIVRQTRSKRLARLAETALRSANRGAKLTNQLLSFARRQALNTAVVDLEELVSEMDMLLRRAAGEAVDMIFDSKPGLWRCRVDPAQFEAAVINLVTNARDAMPGGGQLVLSARNIDAREIPAGTDLKPGHYIAFSVRDSGEGMAPEILRRAFEPFFTTKEIGRGSGLGLSMVYGFAKQSGGGVHLDSRPATGTCVTLYLPRAEAAIDTANAVNGSEPPRSGVGSILVVEDDADVREVTVAMLESLGYRAEVVGNGLEALRLLRDNGHFDLLFTDLVMPLGVSGVELARHAVAIRPGMKVLLTSGYRGPREAAEDEFPLLPKPFRPHQLGQALSQLLGAVDGAAVARGRGEQL